MGKNKESHNTWISAQQLQASADCLPEQPQHHDQDRGKYNDYIEKLYKGQRKRPVQ